MWELHTATISKDTVLPSVSRLEAAPTMMQCQTSRKQYEVLRNYFCAFYGKIVFYQQSRSLRKLPKLQNA
jgi:hypothetical protein